MMTHNSNNLESWPKLVPELYVRSLEQSLDFYVNILGFQIKYDRPEEGFAYLDKQGVHIMLEQYDKSARTWWTADFEHPLGRGVNFQIEITDVDALYKVLTDVDYTVFMPIEDKWYRANDVMTGNRQFIVQDPDGYLLRFFTELGDRPLGD